MLVHCQKKQLFQNLKKSIAHCLALVFKSFFGNTCVSEVPIKTKRKMIRKSIILHFSGSGITLMALERNVAHINDLKTDPPGTYTINEPGLLNSSALSLLNYS